MRDHTERIWKEYRDRLHSFIEARVDDTHTADDILQEVCVRIHSQIDSLRNRDKIQSWVYQITRNAIIDHYRAHNRLEELPAALAIAGPELRDKARGDIILAPALCPIQPDSPEHALAPLRPTTNPHTTQAHAPAKQHSTVVTPSKQDTFKRRRGCHTPPQSRSAFGN
ncbi:MAG: sigma factor [Planctomycetota bacterium]|jgi:RNA polymerase sigma factor (sigma-70 family)